MKNKAEISGPIRVLLVIGPIIPRLPYLKVIFRLADEVKSPLLLKGDKELLFFKTIRIALGENIAAEPLGDS